MPEWTLVSVGRWACIVSGFSSSYPPEAFYYAHVSTTTVEGAALVAVLARDVEHVARKYRLLK
jgi:hypothetical protein